jgi:hypothetical protein
MVASVSRVVNSLAPSGSQLKRSRTSAGAAASSRSIASRPADVGQLNVVHGGEASHTSVM